MGELGVNQVFHVNSSPIVPDEEVMIACKRLDALAEAVAEIFQTFGSSLVSDGMHDAENILGAMNEPALDPRRDF
jgi:hypothetical protein